MSIHKCGSVEFSTELKRKDDVNLQVVCFKNPVSILSSSFYNGGLTETSTVAIMEVPKNYPMEDPVQDAIDILNYFGLPLNTVFFMTAAEIDYVFNVVDENYNGSEASAIVTAGLSNQVIAGDILENWEKRHELSNERSRKMKEKGPVHVGTINTIVVSSLSLSVAGMVNASIAITEGKTAAMNVMGYSETGTTSDAIAVIVPSIGEENYAGTGTDIGISMARAVKKAVCRALIIRDDFSEHMTQEQKDAVVSKYMH